MRRRGRVSGSREGGAEPLLDASGIARVTVDYRIVDTSTGAQLMAKEGAYAQVKLPSGEVRKIHVLCRATVGQVSNGDHKNLNLDTEYFKELNPTAENIAVVIWRILRQKIDSKLELKITLYETERNFVEYPAS